MRKSLDAKISDLVRDVADLSKMCGASEAREKELKAENVRAVRKSCASWLWSLTATIAMMCVWFQVQTKQRLEDLRRQLEKAGKSSKKDLDSMKKKLRSTHKAELDKLINNHIEETEILNKEFLRVQDVMTQQNELLEQRLSELQNLFDNRSSRPEDLERIAELTTENAELADEVAKLVKDMKYYKLELLNREKNFNKLFNASPNVGVMSVLKTSVPNTGPQSGSRQARSAGPIRQSKSSSRSRSRSQTRR